jgi:hypothetical protein
MDRDAWTSHKLGQFDDTPQAKDPLFTFENRTRQGRPKRFLRNDLPRVRDQQNRCQ